MTNQQATILMKLGDSSVPANHRIMMMGEIINNAKEGEDEDSMDLANEILNRMQAHAIDALAREKIEQVNDMLKALEGAPLKPVTFIQLSATGESANPHALVSADNGELAYVVAHDPAMAKSLRLGDRVMVDVRSKLLVKPASNDLHCGREVKFERKLDDRHVEVITQQDEKEVVLVGQEIMDEIKSGKVSPGQYLILGSGGRLGVKVVPKPDQGLSHYRFLDHGPIPDVVVERDIGSPPQVIAQVERHIREEMLRPELRRRFRLRPCITRLMCGVSGSGKTLAVQAIHRRMYEIMVEVTGTPIEQLPKRVFRFRISQILSMWLGESDKNADRIFDEVEQLAPKTFVNAKGEEFNLPLLVIMEEADGMGRSRGSDHDGIYDRILTTILQRLDPNRKGLSDQMVVFLSTTNEPHMVDPAMLRRIGGSIETFGRLSQEAFISVIHKHIAGLPAQSKSGQGQKAAWKAIISDIHEWLFLPGGDPGVVELSYRFGSHPAVKYRRDFLTGALIDRSVQQAATEAWELSLNQEQEVGISRDHLMNAINHQVQSLVDQLCVQNVSHYLDIPEGTEVTNVRRIGQ